MSLKEKIKKLLESGDLEELESLLSGMDMSKWDEYIIDITYDHKSLASYSVVCMMLIKRETSRLHCLASAILTHSLCPFEGSYKAALYHIRKAVKIDPNDIGLKEALLFFHEVPDCLVGIEEAKKLIREILEVKPDSKCALGALRRMEDFAKIAKQIVSLYVFVSKSHPQHYFDEAARLNVTLSVDGYLEGAWKLRKGQAKYVLLNGSVK